MMTPNSPEPGINARILVVDDESTTRSAVTRALGLIGYQADGAASGTQALARLSARSYDLMLLDLRMPEMDGVEVMVRARESHPNLQVIVFTAYASVDSAISAVRAGAADYLLKPCSIKEIAAAIARVLKQRQERLRRQQLMHVMAETLEDPRAVEGLASPAISEPQERFIPCGSMTLDQDKRIAVINGPDGANLNCDLTTNETKILAFLMRHPDRVFSCRELAQATLGYEVTEAEAEDILRPHIFRLRKKIEPNLANPTRIRTVRGRGYFFSPR